MLEYLQAKFSCDNDGGQFRGMTNYENMINYLTEIRRWAEKLRNKNQSILGCDEDAEHDFKITRLNNLKSTLHMKTINFIDKHNDITPVFYQ